MKSIRTLFSAIVFLAILGFAIQASAHVDAYLYFKDSTGKSIAVKIHTDGSFQTPPLHVGTYSVSFGVRQRIAPVASSNENPKETLSTPYTITVNPHIQPPSATAGQPTGRRMHKPLTIMKVLDKASPKLITDLGTITIDVGGDGLAGTVTFNYKNGGKMMMDKWDAK